MAQYFSPPIAFALIAAGCVVGLAGIDLVLPVVPQLPDALGTTPTGGQLVIAAYVGGSAAGLLLFGSLGPGLAIAAFMTTPAPPGPLAFLAASRVWCPPPRRMSGRGC
jgi:hypothetical protein